MDAAAIAIPDWESRWNIPPEGVDDAVALAIPAKAAVVALETDDGRTVMLAATADARRFVRSRLQAPASPGDVKSDLDERRGEQSDDQTDVAASPTADLRSLVRRVRLIRVGSAFEADWVYLEHARRREASGHQLLLDRWRGWFVRADLAAEHPRLTKTNRPRLADQPGQGNDDDASPASVVHLGPVGEKHAAQQMIETLQDIFDLCRYHHILVQAPNAAACAYKEMGRCPAPCDGTVSLSSYREQLDEAMRFARDGFKAGAAELDREMNEASERMDFEAAASLREKLDRATPLLRKPFEHVRRVERLAWAAVLPGERKGWARVMAIRGGAINIVADVPLDVRKSELDDVVEALNRRLAQNGDLSHAGLERLGLVCWRLFRKKRSPRDGAFLPVSPTAGVDAAVLYRALGRLRRATDKKSAADDGEDAIAENQLDATM